MPYLSGRRCMSALTTELRRTLSVDRIRTDDHSLRRVCDFLLCAPYELRLGWVFERGARWTALARVARKGRERVSAASELWAQR